MSNPYYHHDTGRPNVAGNPINGPMMKPPPTSYYSPTQSNTGPVPPQQQPVQYQQQNSNNPYNTAQSPQTNMWQPNQGAAPNLPPPTSGYVNGFPQVPGARSSPLQRGPPPPQGGFSPGHVPNARTYSPQMTPPPPPTSFPQTVNRPPGQQIPPPGNNTAPFVNAPNSNVQQNYAPPLHPPFQSPQISNLPGKNENAIAPPPPSHISTTPLSGQMQNQPNFSNQSSYSQNNHNHMPPPPTMLHQQQPSPVPPPGVNQMHRQPQMFPPGHQQPPNVMPPPGPGPTMPPNAPGQFPYSSMPGVTQGLGNLSMHDKHRPVDVMQERRLLPLKKHQQKPLKFETGPGDRGLIPPKRKNCSTDVFRCTLNAIPHTQAMLNKVKLPLGLIIHPFKDLSSLPVISAGTIVRCKRCRTYINPFVNFLDERRWRCNLCFVVNDVPEEFLHHPVTKTYGEPHTRPECTNATLEFIAPQEYMVRPPQPAVYMFLFDVSHSAVETGYLQVVCDALLDHLDHLPGDSRTKIGFITYNGTVHFYKMSEGSSQPQMLVVSDLDDVFLPTPDALLVNLKDSKELVCDLLRQLPEIHEPPDNLSRGEVETQSALGAALQVAQKMMSAYGGRVTVFQQSMPTAGPGALKQRENPNSRAGESTTESLNPSTDFYKKLALDSSAHQIAMDFFFMNSQFIDIATLSCASRYSAGDLHYYPGLHVTHNPVQVDRLSRDLDRYLTRKIGFEAVMRIRCTKGLAIHTFHGNFFVRSTDLLALANINPDAGFGLNLSIEESLTDLSSICIQAALLYTSSKGERRIRVHTMCFPVAKTPIEIFNNVDSDAVVSLLSKMAVDRSITAKISDARDAMLNAVIDALKAYKESVNPNSVDNSILVPPCMRTFPLFISCLLKHPSFRAGVSTRLDDRVFSMIDLKMQPACFALQSIHPDLYRVDNLSDDGGLDIDERIVPQPPLLPLSAESIDRDGVYLLDAGWHMYLHVSPNSNRQFIQNVLGVEQFSNIEQPMYSLPDMDNAQADTFHNFVDWLQDQRPHFAPMQVLRADCREHYNFMMHMRKDKTESSLSFQEFLLHVKQQMTK